MSRVGFTKTIMFAAVMAAMGAASAAKAATITFASYTETVSNAWTYSNATGALTANAAGTFFAGAGGGVVNFTGLTTETLSAVRTGNAVNNAGTLSQTFSGTLTFKNGATTILQVTFTDAILAGTPSGTTSSGFTADNGVALAGTINSFVADPSVLIGAFVQPFRFSISLSQIPGLTLGANNNFADFTARSSGQFQVDESGVNPTPLPAAAWGGMSLMGALGGVRAFIKRRRR